MPTYSVGKIFQLVLLCARPPFQRDANEDGVHTVLFVRMRRLEWFTRYQPQGKRLNSWKRSRTVCSVTVFTSCEIGAHVEVSTYPVNLSWRNERKYSPELLTQDTPRDKAVTWIKKWLYEDNRHIEFVVKEQNLSTYFLND